MKILYESDLLIWLQGAIVAILCVITLNKKAFSLISNAIDEIQHVKLLIGLTASCLLMIGFVISFHAEVFTSHDHYNIAKTKDGSKRNGYNWFNLGHIFRFPVEQLVPESSIIQINTFDISMSKKNRFNNYLYIVDKTGSTEETVFMKKLAQSVKKNLQNGLSRENATYREYINSLNDLADLLLIQSINEIAHSNPNAKFRVGLYTGNDPNQPIDYLSDYKIASSENVGNFIQLYKTQSIGEKNSLNYKINSQQNYKYPSLYRVHSYPTDYVELVQDICDYGCHDFNKDIDSLSISLIGDLCHEKENNLQGLKKSLYALSSKNVEQINLFRLPFNPHRLPYGWDSTKADIIASQVANNFKQNFHRGLLYTEINTSNIIASEYPKDFINSQIIQPNKPIGQESEISVYFPFASAYYLNESMSKIEITKENTPFYGEIIVALKTFDGKEDLAEVEVNDIKIKVDNIEKINLAKGSINLNFRSESNQENYYLDMYFPSDKTRITAPLVFRERLTTTASLCLIFLYTLLYMSITLLISIIGLLIYRFPVRYPKSVSSLFGIILIAFPIIIFCISYLPTILAIPKTDESLALSISSLFPFIYLSFFSVHIYANTINYINNISTQNNVII
ncbi:hypothetical protein [Spirosoma pollinicola]|uniref:Uncharacterized protein n=1 Tax=Spirosoma pollinicola TaxID=2057025 RepID=A0A2K8Z819_9BACT|nr:hypothetical protein [Spirosoma pollinicola]AUD06011.1 hypothetical protein CWM47_31690 [Spirosoma pollinicola]